MNNGIEKIEYKEDEKCHYILAQDIEVKTDNEKKDDNPQENETQENNTEIVDNIQIILFIK